MPPDQSIVPRRLTPEHIQGIRAKLERSKEMVEQLDAELKQFLTPTDASVFDKITTVPPRFSVISGEVIHQLRSTLDHLVWHVSDDHYRRKHERAVGFPIYLEEPRGRERSNYEKKIWGASSEVKTLIGNLQPYRINPVDPKHTSIAVIHNLNRIDKHQNLVIIQSLVRIHVSIPGEMAIVLKPACEKGARQHDVPQESATVRFQPYVVLEGFEPKREKSVVPSLQRLIECVSDVVDQFIEVAGRT